ncbi:hypothetical protein IFM89_026770 [Coptis chinensis]|uniref:Uncharacterized protein n=1 Tax=Coptis chinensis TaxID=261450 RepID=A0A835IG89_9MAGN|nr:hypothetical protein IFM89_026770 [Coptis chinensis]
MLRICQCWIVTGERQAARIQSLYLEAILRQDVAFFDKETNMGEVIGRMAGDTILIQDAMGEKVGKFIQLFSTFTGGFAIAFTKGWLLTLVLLSSIPFLVISGALMAIVVSKMASRGQVAYSQAGIVVDQTAGSIRTHAIILYKKYIKKAYESGAHEGLASGLGFGAVMLIVFCTYALAVWFGGKMIIEKGYNGGVVINIIIAVLTGSLHLHAWGHLLLDELQHIKMFETINRKPQIDSSDTNGRILDDILGDIELRDVCFSYPARPDEPIFDGFSLSMHSGTTSALVGQSGSGKSTVISLIERYYDPQAGEILIDGINLREFQLRWVREKIGLVGQELVLFSSSIKDNIAYSKDGATIEEITAAAELANVAKFIDKLPQRLAIARAILKDPRILLLDEATSALDVESEHIVQEALDRIMVNRTTVIVVHRLSTIKNADMIAVVHQGKVVEKGHIEETAVTDRECTPPAPIEQTQEVPLRRLAYLNKPEIPILLLGVIFAVVNGVIFPVFGLLLSSVIKTFFEPKQKLWKDSRFWALMFITLGVVSFIASPGRTYFFSVAGCRLIQRIHSMCFKKVVHMEINWFDEPEHSGRAIGAKLSADAATVRSLVGDALALLVHCPWDHRNPNSSNDLDFPATNRCLAAFVATREA